MTLARQNHLPGNGQFETYLASQVANVAAQVSTAMQSGDADQRDALEAQLGLACEQLKQRGAPPGLIPFIDVLRGLLRGRDVSARTGDLPDSYRALVEQIVGELAGRGEDGELTVGAVLDEVTRNVILALERGTFEQRRQMADTLFVMAQESSSRPDLAALRDFVIAAHILLKGGDPSSFEARLPESFQDKWQEILDALENNNV